MHRMTLLSIFLIYISQSIQIAVYVVVHYFSLQIRIQLNSAETIIGVNNHQPHLYISRHQSIPPKRFMPTITYCYCFSSNYFPNYCGFCCDSQPLRWIKTGISKKIEKKSFWTFVYKTWNEKMELDEPVDGNGLFQWILRVPANINASHSCSNVIPEGINRTKIEQW